MRLIKFVIIITIIGLAVQYCNFYTVLYLLYSTVLAVFNLCIDTYIDIYQYMYQYIYQYMYIYQYIYLY